MGDVEALTDRVMLIGKGQLLYDGSFARMKSKYNTVSILTIDYDPATPLSLPEHTALLSDGAGRAVLSVDTLKTPVSRVISALSGSLTVRDIAVASRPIEEIIAEVYTEYML
jgi:ABC-2 type transport system ATP-binding protein